jgi:hypothetical protein
LDLCCRELRFGGGGEPPETEVVAKRRGGAGIVDRWFNVGGGAPTIELGLGRGRISTDGCRGGQGGANRWQGVGGTASVVGSRRAVPEGRPARKVVGEA